MNIPYKTLKSYLVQYKKEENGEVKELTRYHHGGTFTVLGMHDFEVLNCQCFLFNYFVFKQTWNDTATAIDKKIEEFQENGLN